MRRLILMRHAKSSWAVPGRTDFERPLNARGRRSAPLLGRWLSEKGYRPEHALVSSARRTRETWECLGLGDVPATCLDAIYEAAPGALKTVLERAPDVDVLLMIGHQPGIGALAAGLLAEAPEDVAFDLHPTGATSVIDFDVTAWADADWGSGTLRDFVTPRALETRS